MMSHLLSSGNKDLCQLKLRPVASWTKAIVSLSHAQKLRKQRPLSAYDESWWPRTLIKPLLTSTLHMSLVICSDLSNYLSHCCYTIAWDRLSNQFLFVCICVCVCVCACVRACVRACMHACMHVCMHTYIYTSDGRHLGFRFWAIISASINIFACFLC